MEIRHLRSFQVLAEELHFGRAAARLHISQPPLTAHIKELEREVGTALFHRSTRRVSLTDAGEIFAVRVGDILGSLDEAVAEVRAYASGKRGRVRVGFVSSASGTVLGPGLRMFRDRRPEVQLDLSPLTTREQIDALSQGDLDVGLIRSAGSGPGYTAEVLVEEPLVAVMPATHRLAGKAEVEIADLLEEKLILFPAHLMPGYVAQIWSLFTPHGAEPRVVQEAIHHETVLGFVSADVGISILPASVSRFRTDDIAIRPISGSPTTPLMVARNPESRNPAVGAFIDCLYAALPGDLGVTE
ncbi:LysR family transcriptional regulator [Gordonia westfalica]|uniref:LysR family transcriptional regulator n=1 Tax=Gordonia westfalica TaxID=158898 RepID=A0ABU2GN75_9ACTN|nr:LysR family transcriptional regulator [Gordonia westfalica]MDS1112896.1 LysR family transcriptional regulator [Gordonia westfalica]